MLSTHAQHDVQHPRTHEHTYTHKHTSTHWCPAEINLYALHSNRSGADINILKLHFFRNKPSHRVTLFTLFTLFTLYAIADRNYLNALKEGKAEILYLWVRWNISLL